MRIQNKVKESIGYIGMTQKDLSELTGIRESTIGEICRNTKTVINLDHMAKIMKALNITDFNLMFEIKEK